MSQGLGSALLGSVALIPIGEERVTHPAGSFSIIGLTPGASHTGMADGLFGAWFVGRSPPAHGGPDSHLMANQRGSRWSSRLGASDGGKQ